MFYDITKRIIDIIGAIVLLTIFSPVCLVTAIAIKLTSPGPVFADTPRRVGKEGKLFYPFKFRSMIPNAYQLLKNDPKFKKFYKEKQTSGFYKIKEDPRITPVGRVIRKYSVDEIPQLVNVLKGEMSIVGPRPYYPEEIEKQQREYSDKKHLFEEVLSVKPGITGYWQITGRSNVPFEKRIELDAYYARRRSILLDILILFKTTWAMISGKGAV